MKASGGMNDEGNSLCVKWRKGAMEMAQYTIFHSPHLSGEVFVNTSKNAVLPIMAAGLLTKEPFTIEEVPNLTDVKTLAGILQSCGAAISKNGSNFTITAGDTRSPGDEAGIRMMRASVLVMGPILARTGYVKVALPGGCAIGQRPIDLHLKGMEALGAQVEIGAGAVTLTGKLKGGNVYLDLPSVGATENIMMAACLAKGDSLIENAAKEPEIIDLADCLIAMGAKIRGAGTGSISIEGVSCLHGISYRPIPDRIEAGTLCCAAALTHGSVLVRGARPDHMRSVLFKLRECGVNVRESKAGIRLTGQASNPIQLRTLSYPGFPTDMQAPMMVVTLLANGTSVLLETVFENRYMHAQELRRMGASIQLEDRVAVVKGGKALQGTSVTSSDLRAGAALLLAGLIAQGSTTVSDPDGTIARGYENLPQKLCALGAKIEVK
jgi:UDP-N-acetylglucosamine 1-carboxyvinyltransferase